MDTEKNNQAPPDPADVPATLPAVAGSTVKLPIFLRWPLLVVLLFVLPPFGTIAALVLAVIRLVFSHKHPQYKLKIRTKVIVGVCCAAFFAWCMTLEPSEGLEPSANPSSAQAESAAPQQTALIDNAVLTKRHEKIIQEMLAQMKTQQLSVSSEPLKENTVMKNETKEAV